MRILVVDDQAANRGLLSYLLEEEGHDVVEASNGLDCLDKYKQVSPDLVLMDVMMPGMDGYEAARRIKAETDTYVPIIFLTALSDDNSLSKCIESGGDDFLTKPVNETLLTAKIKAHERIRELNRELSDKNRELEQLHGLLKQEYELAEYVLENAISSKEAFTNINCFLSPMSGFSGDVIIAARTNRDSMFVMLGDFTGHGLPAALGALPVTQVFESLAAQGATLGELATEINRTLYKYLPSYMFCAANIMEIDKTGKQISCWLGGLPDMFLIDNHGLIRKALKSTHMPLGVLSDEAFKIKLVNLALEDGERLITYSDGVTDCCDISGEMLGEARFEMMFDGSSKLEGLFPFLVESIQSYGQGRPQIDDISMLEVTSKPIPER